MKVTELSKRAMEDATITVGSPDGKSRVMIVPKGTYILMSVMALHHNRE